MTSSRRTGWCMSQVAGAKLKNGCRGDFLGPGGCGGSARVGFLGRRGPNWTARRASAAGANSANQPARGLVQAPSSRGKAEERVWEAVLGVGEAAAGQLGLTSGGGAGAKMKDVMHEPSRGKQCQPAGARASVCPKQPGRRRRTGVGRDSRGRGGWGGSPKS